MARNFRLILAICVVLFWGPVQAASFRDALNRPVRLDSPPQRIVAMAPSITEILYYLGLGDRVAGVTRFSSYPDAAREKPKIGSYIHLNVERILSLEPDLAVGTADGNRKAVVDLLEQAGIPVYIVNPRGVREALDTIGALAEVCGMREKAQPVVRRLKSRVECISERTRGLIRPPVFLQINLRPMMTVNRSTFHHDVIQLGGGDNIFSGAAATYPRVGIEEVIERRPEVIIISSMEREGRFRRAKEEWRRWQVIPAVRKGRIHLVDSDLLDRPSPRIVDGLETMAKIIHPELQWEPAERTE